MSKMTNEEKRVDYYSNDHIPTDPPTVSPNTPLAELNLNWKEKALLSWIAPRGIVAAAVSALFALKLETAGWQGADILVPMVFMVIITTVVLQSLTAKFVAGALGLQEPAAQGFLIFGANPVARAIARAAWIASRGSPLR